jgi:signal transduction histidine kinase
MFAAPALGETLRAFLVFGAMLLALVGTAARMSFRGLEVKVINARVNLAQEEADRIANTVSRIGLDGDGINFANIRRNQALLKNYIRERISQSLFIHHVEVRDRFDVLQLFVARTEDEPEPLEESGVVPLDWPAGSAAEHVVRSTLGRSDGEVLVALPSRPVISELTQLERTLRFRVWLSYGFAVLVLVVGFFYVLHLLRKNRALDQARQSAARASYVGLLASGLAHEIRNPLNAMNMNLQMLEDDLQQLREQDPEIGTMLESTKREIKRLERLVNNFLAYARPAAARFERRDLNELVADLVRFLDEDFKQAGVELAAELEPLLPTVELDETQFKQALINLMVNARQVLPKGGKVVARTRAGVHGEVVVEIEDDGPGIPLDAQERIFEVFYSSRGGGTGLGLPIARQVVERHGGTIELDSELGRGTTFRIRLRRRHDETRETTV